MTKYVIGPDVALRLAHDDAMIPDEHQLLAPTLLRSQTLALLYRAVRHGEMTKKDADRQLNYVRSLRIRLQAAWPFAMTTRAFHDPRAAFIGVRGERAAA